MAPSMSSFAARYPASSKRSINDRGVSWDVFTVCAVKDIASRILLLSLSVESTFNDVAFVFLNAAEFKTFSIGANAVLNHIAALLSDKPACASICDSNCRLSLRNALMLSSNAFNWSFSDRVELWISASVAFTFL